MPVEQLGALHRARVFAPDSDEARRILAAQLMSGRSVTCVGHDGPSSIVTSHRIPKFATQSLAAHHAFFDELTDADAVIIEDATLTQSSALFFETEKGEVGVQFLVGFNGLPIRALKNIIRKRIEYSMSTPADIFIASGQENLAIMPYGHLRFLHRLFQNNEEGRQSFFQRMGEILKRADRLVIINKNLS